MKIRFFVRLVNRFRISQNVIQTTAIAPVQTNRTLGIKIILIPIAIIATFIDISTNILIILSSSFDLSCDEPESFDKLHVSNLQECIMSCDVSQVFHLIICLNPNDLCRIVQYGLYTYQIILNNPQSLQILHILKLNILKQDLEFFGQLWLDHILQHARGGSKL